MTEAECTAGNMTTCQTPQVLRQAAYETKRSTQLHHYMVLELDLQRLCWKAALPGKHVSGYVQAIGLRPFFVLAYTEMQLMAYIDSCSSTDGGILHLTVQGL